MASSKRVRAYIVRRLLLIIPILFIVSFIIFFVIDLVPGDIIDTTQAQSLDITLDRAALERKLGLDASLIVQYARWMGFIPQMDGRYNGVFQGNLGTSWAQKSPVIQLLAKSWPVTLELGLMGLLIAELMALPIGIYSAMRQDKLGDYIGRSFAILAISVPGFWLATVIIVFPAIWWDYMPPIMFIYFKNDPIGNLKMFIVPAVVLGMGITGTTMRMTRTMMLEVLRQDYIRTAWAKGLKEIVVTGRHALKNALIPVVSMIGLQVPSVLGGTIIIENIFCLPGMGRLITHALLTRDKPILCGAVLFFGVFLVLINLAVDLSYAVLDPRVQYN